MFFFCAGQLRGQGEHINRFMNTMHTQNKRQRPLNTNKSGESFRALTQRLDTFSAFDCIWLTFQSVIMSEMLSRCVSAKHAQDVIYIFLHTHISLCVYACVCVCPLLFLSTFSLLLCWVLLHSHLQNLRLVCDPAWRWRRSYSVERCDWSAENMCQVQSLFQATRKKIWRESVCEIDPVTLENSHSAFSGGGPSVDGPVWKIQLFLTSTGSVVRRTKYRRAGKDCCLISISFNKTSAEIAAQKQP